MMIVLLINAGLMKIWGFVEGRGMMISGEKAGFGRGERRFVLSTRKR